MRMKYIPKVLIYLLYLKQDLIYSQFSSVAQSCLTLYDPVDCSTPGLPVHHQLLEFGGQPHVKLMSIDSEFSKKEIVQQLLPN